MGNKVIDQIRTLKFEFQTLSSKKPNDTVNQFKPKYVNLSLQAANDFDKQIIEIMKSYGFTQEK